MQQNRVGLPEWARRVVNAADSIPLTDLKAHIRAEAQALPDLLHVDGSQQTEREALLSLKMKCARVLEAMHAGPFDKLPEIKPKKLRKRLATEAAELPAALNGCGEIDRAQKIYRVKVMCHRLLGLLLALGLFVGTCPLCEFWAQELRCDPVEFASGENILRDKFPQG